MSPEKRVNSNGKFLLYSEVINNLIKRSSCFFFYFHYAFRTVDWLQQCNIKTYSRTFTVCAKSRITSDVKDILLLYVYARRYLKLSSRNLFIFANVTILCYYTAVERKTLFVQYEICIRNILSNSCCPLVQEDQLLKLETYIIYKYGRK